MPPATGAPSVSAPSPWTHSGSTWRRSAASRRIATSARPSFATSRSTGMPTSAASDPAVWDPAERLPRAELRELQRTRLRATFGVELDALAQAPFSAKADLRDGYPFGLLRVPVSSLVRLHASSGTFGKPTVVG